jgi:hypothetical protein
MTFGSSLASLYSNLFSITFLFIIVSFTTFSFIFEFYFIILSFDSNKTSTLVTVISAILLIV